ncbi:adenosylcobinamide-GDP ribazoletransferase [Vibrio lentus]|nr:adenosylcobinamide-GDP ribazoletransferase [Vibrio lentus]
MLHEDGLTDMADGIGGGMTLERRLTIMKDSQLVLMARLLWSWLCWVKWALLNELVSMTGLLWLSSRVIPLAVRLASLIYDMPYR